MGDKIMSKQIADRAMVNTIPGYEGEVDTVEQASKIGAELGYPIMLKASAGGGGTGLKMVRNESQVEENFLLARAEVRAEPCAPAPVELRAERRRGACPQANAAFGDDRMLIEKFVERPRHIEIQVRASPRCGSAGLSRGLSAHALRAGGRCCATGTGTACTSTSASARCSAGTRRCWRRRPPSCWTRRRARPWDSRPSPSRARWTTAAPAPSSSSCDSATPLRPTLRRRRR